MCKQLQAKKNVLEFDPGERILLSLSMIIKSNNNGKHRYFFIELTRKSLVKKKESINLKSWKNECSQRWIERWHMGEDMPQGPSVILSELMV